MKFDVVVGNPPYQVEVEGDNKTFAAPVYNLFMDLVRKIADESALITPARFLFNAGATSKSWNEQILNDKHTKVLYYEKDSSKVFPNTDIKGGVAITYHNGSKVFTPIGTFTSDPQLNTIMKKIQAVTNKYMDTIITGRGVYKLSNLALELFPEIEKKQSKGHKRDVGSGAFKILSDTVFYSERQDYGQEWVEVLGLLNGERVYWWTKKEYLDVPASFDKYKVIMPQANGNGKFGEIISSPLVLDPFMGATETFLSVGSFENETEANSALKYLKSKFSRAMLGILKITKANTKDKWKLVPLQDFTDQSDIDWSKSISEIDQQLYKKYELDQNEIDFIEEKVKAMS